MKRFRVENYRCIQDSGWVELDDIAIIVGKNESGKTALLKALWKLNPYVQQTYSLAREWPRGHRKEKSEDKTVVSAQFSFTEEEQRKIADIDESAQGITGAIVSRNYKGSYTYSFIPEGPSGEHRLDWVVSVITKHLGACPAQATQHFQSGYAKALADFTQATRAGGGSAYAVQHAVTLKSNLPRHVSPNQPEQAADNQVVQQLAKAVEAMQAELSISPPLRRAVDMVHEWLPTFIYMDDYKIFRGSAQLNEVKARRDRKQLTEEDETVIMIMDQAGLNIDEEVKKGGEADREQRMLDMNDASQTLTTEISHRWSQKKYEVMFQADGQHFITFVKDADSKVLVPLEERSKGFQWFFSFDMTFMCESRGSFANAVILLDEPGLHLHAAAQRDLLERMKAYAAKNQLIYSTHLPFMIDFARLDAIHVAEDQPGKGTVVHRDWAAAGKDARFTLQAALGLSWSQSLFIGQDNLVVEGVTDFWFLTTISALLTDAGKEGLDDRLVVTPAGGATKAAYVGTILNGQRLNVAVLLDSDAEGKTAYEQLVHQWILADKQVLMLGGILGSKESCSLEDLFDTGYYLAQVKATYAKELTGKGVRLSRKTQGKPIVDRIASALADVGIPRFNKGRVAKRIMSDLAIKKLADLDEGTVTNFQKVVTAINMIVGTWRTQVQQKQ